MMATKLTSNSVLCLQQRYRQKYWLLVLPQQNLAKNWKTTPEGGERLKFGSRPDFNRKFDFKKELGWLPFPVNMGEVEMTESQQKQVH